MLNETQARFKMNIMQGSEARLLQDSITEFNNDIKNGTYKVWPISKFKKYPKHSQHRELKLYSEYKLLPQEIIKQYRKELDLVDFVDIGEHSQERNV